MNLEHSNAKNQQLTNNQESQINCSAHSSGQQQQTEQHAVNGADNANASAEPQSDPDNASIHSHETQHDPLTSDTRWDEAINAGGMSEATKEQQSGQNDAKSRWKRTGFYAERITGTDGREQFGNEQDGAGAGGDAQEKAKALAPNKQM